jgi:hypothetical protein|tara:strand:- start:683 stop:895 length:213 start_codon:yes stop_codon:yes gene_type:complete
MLQDTNEFIVFSHYQKDSKKATVVKQREKGYWGVHMSVDDKKGLLEWYPTHSETWAENVAENFVEGIRQI